MADSDEIRINELEQPDKEKSSKSYTTPSFSYQKKIIDENGECVGEETVNLEVPLLTIEPIPFIKIEDTTKLFCTEVTSQESSKSMTDETDEHSIDAATGYGPFSAKVDIKGSIAGHERDRKSVNPPTKASESTDGFKKMQELLAEACKQSSVSDDENGKSNTISK